jgi:hypothetical protein
MHAPISFTDDRTRCLEATLDTTENATPSPPPAPQPDVHMHDIPSSSTQSVGRSFVTPHK